MGIDAGIFGDHTNFEHRYIDDHKKLARLVEYWRDMGLRIVLTSGTWDLFHVGHARYLELAKEQGDILIVGVDSDAKVRKRKGPHRPVVPEEERVSVLSHIRHVDIITLKGPDDEQDALIRMIRPDVLTISDSTGHPEDALERKAQYCGKIVRLVPQSTTSTTAKVRLLHVDGANRFANALKPRITALIDEVVASSDPERARALSAIIPDVVDEVLQQVRKV